MLSVFAKKTVADVMAAFNKAIDDLKNVERTQLTEAEKFEVEAEQAAASAKSARQEAALAKSVAEKLINIVQPELAEIEHDAEAALGQA